MHACMEHVPESPRKLNITNLFLSGFTSAVDVATVRWKIEYDILLFGLYGFDTCARAQWK